MDTETEPAKTYLHNLRDEQFWRSLNPDLTISEYPLAGAAPFADLDNTLVDTSFVRICAEGYFAMPPLIPKAICERLAGTIKQLVALDIPPVFAFMYDEYWQLFGGLTPFLSLLLGPGYKLTPTETWIWHVSNTSTTKTGWAPHRDLAPGKTLRADRTPRVMSLWLPLTDATPDNGCMYVIPTQYDPQIASPPGPALSTSQTLHNVRALPAKAGSLLGWNTEIMHWGGKSSDWTTEPRISVGIYLQSGDVDLNEFGKRELLNIEPELFDHSFHLSFEERVTAIAGTLRIYRCRVELEYPNRFEALQAFSDEFYHRYKRSERPVD